MKLLVSCFAILEFAGSRGVGSVLVMWWCLLSLLCVKLWCMLAAKYILSRNIVPCGIMISYLVILSELYVLSVHRTKSLIVRFLVIYGCLFVIWYFIKKKTGCHLDNSYPLLWSATKYNFAVEVFENSEHKTTNFQNRCVSWYPVIWLLSR